MRICNLLLVLATGVGLASCNRRDTTERRDPAARQVGREAYRSAEELKRGAKKAAQEARKIGKELREGWNEAKREDPPPRKK